MSTHTKTTYVLRWEYKINDVWRPGEKWADDLAALEAHVEKMTVARQQKKMRSPVRDLRIEKIVVTHEQELVESASVERFNT